MLRPLEGEGAAQRSLGVGVMAAASGTSARGSAWGLRASAASPAASFPSSVPSDQAKGAVKILSKA